MNSDNTLYYNFDECQLQLYCTKNEIKIEVFAPRLKATTLKIIGLFLFILNSILFLLLRVLLNELPSPYITTILLDYYAISVIFLIPGFTYFLLKLIKWRNKRKMKKVYSLNIDLHEYIKKNESDELEIGYLTYYREQVSGLNEGPIDIKSRGKLSSEKRKEYQSEMTKEKSNLTITNIVILINNDKIYPILPPIVFTTSDGYELKFGSDRWFFGILLHYHPEMFKNNSYLLNNELLFYPIENEYFEPYSFKNTKTPTEVYYYSHLI